MFQSSPYEKELLTLYGKLVPETQEYLLVIAKELLKIQQKLLHEGESRHLHDEK